MERNSEKDGLCIQLYKRMCRFSLRKMVCVSISTKMTTRKAVLGVTIRTLWVDLYATTINATRTDGQAGRLPSLYECIQMIDTMQGSITNAAKAAIALANRFWMIRMRKELRIVLRNGTVYNSRCHATQDGVIVLTRVLYVKDVKMGIAAKWKKTFCYDNEAIVQMRLENHIYLCASGSDQVV